MNKENNRTAGLRRSAIAERIQLREEWSALKGAAEAPAATTKLLTKRLQNRYLKDKKKLEIPVKPKQAQVTSDVLRGVVALVEVGAEARALPLRAALAALGATVVPKWSPLVTHLVWTQGGCRATRAKGRALACRLVSVLWVEACAASARRLPEAMFPAATRASDLPSPTTLRRLLKQAEMQNVPLVDLLSDSSDDEMRLRLSTDTSADTTDVPTRATRLPQKFFPLSIIEEETNMDFDVEFPSGNKDVELRVNMAPHRMPPKRTSPTPSRSEAVLQKQLQELESDESVTARRPRHAPPAALPPKLQRKSRRKLFTQKEPEELDTGDSENEASAVPKHLQPVKLTQRKMKNLVPAERVAKPRANTPALNIPKIVLTGMSRSERRVVSEAIRSLNGRRQSRVTKSTTHVLLGSCREGADDHVAGITNTNKDNPCHVTGIANIDKTITSCITNQIPSPANKARTLSALAGAARGCRVLRAQWALDCAAAGAWLHHIGYEVPHLLKLQQKACVERKALGRTHSEYAYDVFYGMRVKLSHNVDKRDAALHLLTLCDAVVLNPNGEVVRSGGPTHNGGPRKSGGWTQRNGLVARNGGVESGGVLSADFDITIGTGVGEVSSKWVFDSVAAGRTRTVRGYVNHNVSGAKTVAAQDEEQ